MTLKASRWSDGNKVFLTKIEVGEQGLTVKIPGLFSGQTRYLTFGQIGEVSIRIPLIGFSTISFFSAGTQVSAHGFRKDEAHQIKEAIERGQDRK